MQQKMWLWHFCNQVIALVGTYFIFVNGYWGFLTVALIASMMAGLAVNVSLHRYLSHRSFKTGPIRDIFLRWWSVLAGLGPSIMWVIAHRQHHADSDTERDFQNPRVIGKFRSWFTIYPETEFKLAYAKDMLRCKHSRFIYQHYFKIQLALYMIAFVINPWLPVLLFAIPYTFAFHGAASIGVLTHLWGYRVIECKDSSTNNILASFLSFGEGWHNYHHAKPNDYRHGHLWWELDPPAWVIEKFFKI
jgi:stearoyl-CoA desaturase (delta-9 desaturase)